MKTYSSKENKLIITEVEKEMQRKMIEKCRANYLQRQTSKQNNACPNIVLENINTKIDRKVKKI